MAEGELHMASIHPAGESLLRVGQAQQHRTKTKLHYQVHTFLKEAGEHNQKGPKQVLVQMDQPLGVPDAAVDNAPPMQPAAVTAPLVASAVPAAPVPIAQPPAQVAVTPLGAQAAVGTLPVLDSTGISAASNAVVN